MEKKEEIINRLLDNKEYIFFNLCKCSIKKYLQTLPQNINDEKYENNFSNFYNFRGCTKGWRKEYFEILKNKINTSITENNYKKEFIDIAESLYEVSEKKDGKKNHQFSFITKLMHTINPNMPIFDSRIEKGLKINRESGIDYERDAQIILDMLELYNEIVKDDKIISVLEEFDNHYPMQEICAEEPYKKYSNYSITPIKKLDFLLWTLAIIED